MAMKQFPLFNELVAFVIERHKVYLKKQAGKPKPWTKDPILQQYRFCNVYRELDKVTVWIREHWREPHAADPNLWFAMVVARLVNWPDSLEEGGYPAPWKPSKWVAALDARKARGGKTFTGAYMIRGVESNGRSKIRYLAEDVLTPMWEARAKAKDYKASLGSFHAWLMSFRDMGSFMAAQVIADTKYTPLLAKADGWETWAAPGPGSQRGLNRVMGRDVKSPWKEEEWLAKLQDLRVLLNIKIAKAGMEPAHAQDVQSICCEVDKYWRVKNGEGRPRSLYPGGAGQ